MSELAWKLVSLLLITAPLALSGRTPVPAYLYSAFCLAAAALTLVTQRRTRHLQLRPVIEFFILIGLLALCQLVSLPPDMIRLVAPTTWNLYQETVWLVQPQVWMPLSLHPEATVIAFFNLAATGGMALALGQFLVQHDNFSRILNLLSWALIGWAVAAALTPFWSRLPLIVTALSAQQALQIKTGLMLFTVGFLPLLWAGYEAQRPRELHLTAVKQLMAMNRSSATAPHVRLGIKIAVVLCALLSCALAPILLAIPAGWLLYRFALALYEGKAKAAQWGFGISAIFCLGLMLFVSSIFTISAELPTDVQGSAIPWFGYGLDAGGELFDTSSFQYLGAGKKLLTGVGFGGLLLLLISGSTLFRVDVNRQAVRRNRIGRHLFPASLAGLLLITLMGWQSNAVNGVMLLSAVVISLTIAAWSYAPRGKVLEKKIVKGPLFNWNLSLLITSIAGLTICGSIFAYTAHNAASVAQGYSSAALDQSASELADDKLSCLDRAAVWAPLSSELRLIVGQLKLEQKMYPESKEQLVKALKMRPLSPSAAVMAAGIYELTGQGEIALPLMSNTSTQRYKSNFYSEKLSAMLLQNSESAVAMKLIPLILQDKPGHVGRYVRLMALSGRDSRSMRQLLPQVAEAFLAYGDFLLRDGYTREAEEVYLDSIDLALASLAPDPAVFIRVAEFYSNSGQLSKALMLTQAGVNILPDSARLRHLLSELHTEMGYKYKAEQGYSRAQLLNHALEASH